MENRMIEKNVTKTFLNHCIDIKENNSFYQGLNLQKLYRQSEEREERGKQFATSLKVKVKVKLNNEYLMFAQKDDNNNYVHNQDGGIKKLDYVEETIIYQKSGTIGTIRLNISKIAYDLQRIFWFSTLKELFELQFINSCFQEKYQLTLDVAANTFIIEPIQIFDIEKLKDVNLDSVDVINLTKIVKEMTSDGRYRIASYSEKESNKHSNKIVQAGQWKDASEFEKSELGLENCIYYLASDNTDSEPAKMYIGEATTSGKRLITKIIDGKCYIGHREREWEFTDYKFTRYRIDQVDSWEAMHDAQDAMIGGMYMADASDFPNGYRLTNEAFNKAYSLAIGERAKRNR